MTDHPGGALKIFFFSARSYDKSHFVSANAQRHYALEFFDGRLTPVTAPLAHGYDVVCTFVNDVIDADIASTLVAGGTRLIALRCAGFNQVDLAATSAAGLAVVRVPAYSPFAVAEHAIGLILTLNRKFHRAYARVRDDNFLLDGLEGFDIYGKTVGVVGTGRIGKAFAKIMLGFGCRVRAYDPLFQDPELMAAGVEYTELESLLTSADIVSLHCPLTPGTHYLINARTLGLMKRGAMLINTSRGGLLDTAAVIGALKSRQLGALGLDVYEQEGDLFFADLSDRIVDDDIFQRLLTFPNVVVTGHQAFFTQEALSAIAETTLSNIDSVVSGQACANTVTLNLVRAK